MYTIRKAAVSDINYILSQLKEFSEFFDSKYSLYDEESAPGILEMMINEHVFLLAFKDDEPVGFISGFVTPHLFNAKIKTLTETFWWVDKKHRGSRAGLILLNEFVKYGKENCHWIFMTLEKNSPVRDETFTRLGFIEKEKNFLLEV